MKSKKEEETIEPLVWINGRPFCSERLAPIKKCKGRPPTTPSPRHCSHRASEFLPAVLYQTHTIRCLSCVSWVRNAKKAIILRDEGGPRRGNMISHEHEDTDSHAKNNQVRDEEELLPTLHLPFPQTAP